MKDKEQVYIQTRYEPNEPNKPLLLHNGEIILTQDSITLKGDGEITLEWFPQPHLGFKMKFGGGQESDIQKLSYVSIQMPNVRKDVATPGIVSRHIKEGGKTTEVRGTLRAVEPLKFGSSDYLKKIALYLTNFHYGIEPTKIKAGNWECEIREIGEWSLRKELQELQATQGYAITHVCYLSKIDKTNLDGSELESIIDALYYFFSFLRGFWCNLGQVNGLDASGKPIWEFWRAPNVSSTRIQDKSWFIPMPDLLNPSSADSTPPDLGHALEVFLDLWSDETCQKVLRTAIELYLEANIQKNVDTSLILGQIGLETVSYIKNVVKGSMTKEEFEKKKAPELIRLLLDDAKISYDMSNSSYNDLAIYGHKNGIEKKEITHEINDGKVTYPLNGVEIIVRMRNGIVHPDKRDKVFKAFFDERIDIRQLALHYLELSLLFLFEFRGKYKNRMDNSVEETPW